ncbi:MAG TPA: hypothetical protein VK283_02935 [Acidimicrobiales bacterium]|nr:hypothetical protein [Acidimicrobiales bacterium]
MVSKTLASLDAWLALAEDVLAEQSAYQEKEAEASRSHGFDQLTFIPNESA